MCRKVMFLSIWVNYLNVCLNGTSMVQIMAKARVMAQGRIRGVSEKYPSYDYIFAPERSIGLCGV